MQKVGAPQQKQQIAKRSGRLRSAGSQGVLTRNARMRLTLIAVAICSLLGAVDLHAMQPNEYHNR